MYDCQCICETLHFVTKAHCTGMGTVLLKIKVLGTTGEEEFVQVCSTCAIKAQCREGWAVKIVRGLI